MATESQNIYLSRKEKQICNRCFGVIPKGHQFVAETEKSRGTCFKCSVFRHYSLLPSGDAAMTRRSKKHSARCGVVQEWNQRRKRYERKGQYVEPNAILLAKAECEADQSKRDAKNIKAAVVREVKDKEYITEFSIAIRKRYPNCPLNREVKIAEHACEKHSGRVGRTADAKTFDSKMIDLAVEAHIRHAETNYDNEFSKGKRKKEIRSDLKFEIQKKMGQWRIKNTIPSLFKNTTLFILFSILSLNFSLAEDPWELEKNSNGIKVYTRYTSKSSIKEFKAITTINADKLKISNILMKVGNYVSWYPDISESSLLKILNINERIVYYKLDVPWPADDRDAVLKFEIKKQSHEILIKINCLSNYKAKNDGVVRIIKASGFWKLTTNGNKTKVVYQFLTDPAGSLPAWIINMMIVDNPYQTLVSLKKKVE